MYDINEVLAFIYLIFFPEKRYRSFEGFGRTKSKSRSVFRHGTLRWAYAPRSKQPLCLPQCIPNRSDKVSPLCDTPPDPLLIKNRFQNRPLGGRTGPAWSCSSCSEGSCGALMNTHDMTCQLSCSKTASKRLGAMWAFSLASMNSFKNLTTPENFTSCSNYSIFWWDYYKSMFEHFGKRTVAGFGKFLPVVWCFYWSRTSHDLVSFLA